jgi:hypothetical protein
MFSKRILVLVWGVFLILLWISPAQAQMTMISQFKGVEIPFNFKYEESVFKKGKYDLEVLFSKVDAQSYYYLKIMQKGKSPCHIPGQRLEYQSLTIAELAKDPNIPKQPTIRMKKVPASNTVNILFESGKTGNFPFEKVVFKVEQIPEAK